MIDAEVQNPSHRCQAGAGLAQESRWTTISPVPAVLLAHLARYLEPGLLERMVAL